MPKPKRHPAAVSLAGFWRLERQEVDHDLRALKYRAWHRGTREADLLVGGFFDAHHQQWGSRERALFAAMLDEQDADIIAWALGTAEPPARFEGAMMQALKRLDYIRVAR